MPRTLFNSIAVVTLCVSVAAIFAAGKAPQNTGTDDDSLMNLKDRIAALEAERQSFDSNVSSLSQLSPPIGSVIAFAGEWPPSKPDGSKWTELELGWMLCDGDPLEGQDIQAAKELLGDNVPDLRGLFLRGIDTQRPDDQRRDKDGVRAARHVQAFATARPTGNQPFMTELEGGKHKHGGLWHASADDSKIPRWFHNDRDANFWKANSSWKGDRPSLVDMQPMPDANGGHEHSITRGGDAETRPLNVSVHWIIKVSAPRLE